ncbi:MAG: DUF1194 domain-containing protein [Tabrizicola sp.]|jgi:hypothetical protein|nr:DUF1194 domain-containing protein [Tabrizicola sp.]
MTFKAALFAFAIGAGGIAASGAHSRCADLALVLAIDASGSIDAREFDLQQKGYAAAFRDVRVLEALDSAGIVDVAVVLWGDAEMAVQVLDWQRITGPDAAGDLGESIRRMTRQVTGDTGIGRGLSVALDLIEQRQGCAARQIVNVSGDGRESFGAVSRNHVPLEAARARAEAVGVTVNGLAITDSAADLADYYRDNVITGPDAFVMSAASFHAFGEAITRKLAREIALPVLAGLQDGSDRP